MAGTQYFSQWSDVALLYLFLAALSAFLGALIGHFSLGVGALMQQAWAQENEAILKPSFINTLKKEVQDAKNMHVLKIKSRMTFYSALLFVFFVSMVQFSPSIEVALAVCFILLTLTALSAIDIDNNFIPESPILGLAIALLGVMIFIPNARWVDSFFSVLLGVFMVMTLVTLSTGVAKWLARRKGRSSVVMFGDGDTLLLVALSFYFGLDALLALFIACVLLVSASAVYKSYEGLLFRIGHTPQPSRKEEGVAMAFVPFLTLGVAIMSALNMTGWFILLEDIERLF